MSRLLGAEDHRRAGLAAAQLADQLPADLWSHQVAAQSLYLRQQTGPAERYIDRALQIEPGNVASLTIKARLRLYCGDDAGAISLMDTAIRTCPDDAFLQNIMGEILVDAGDVEGAKTAFQHSVNLDPRTAGSLLGLAHLPGDNVSDKLLRQMEFFIQSRQLAPQEQVKAHFALAQAYDRKGRVGKHFAHLHAGNRLKGQALRYDPEVAEREARAIARFFSADRFAQWHSLRTEPARIIFIVGFPRSGSTLVEQILSTHPAVAAAGETYALRYAVADFPRTHGFSAPFPDWLAQMSPAWFADLARDYLRRVEAFNSRDYLTDKALGNYRFVGLISLLFPDARIINVQRDPVDACYSCYKNLFYVNSVPYAYDLEHLARQYRSYRALMRHWEQVLPGRVYNLQYERLVEGQEEVTRALLAFCGLPWDPACLNFHRNTRMVQTSSNAQVRQPLHGEAVGRWQHVERYLGPLLGLAEE